APLAFDASLGTPIIPQRPVVSDGGEVMAVVSRSETSLAQEQAAPAAAPPPPAPPMAAGSFGGGGWAGRPAAQAKKMARRSASVDDGATAEEADAPAESLSLAAPAAAYTRQTRNLAALAAIAVQSGTTR